MCSALYKLKNCWVNLNYALFFFSRKKVTNDSTLLDFKEGQISRDSKEGFGVQCFLRGRARIKAKERENWGKLASIGK